MTTKEKPNLLHEQGQLLCVIKTKKDGVNILRFQLPEISRHAQPGTLLSIAKDKQLIMRVNRLQGWVEVFNNGSLPTWLENTGESELAFSAHTENSFHLINDRPQTLLIGEESGIAPVIFLAEQIKDQQHIQPLALIGFNNDIPFQPQPSQILTTQLPGNVIATLPLLEDWGIACRIAHTKASPGCFDGGLVALAEYWLKQQESLDLISIHVCAHKTVRDGIADLANTFSVPYQAIKLN